jgi:hypothetical protein
MTVADYIKKSLIASFLGNVVGVSHLCVCTGIRTRVEYLNSGVTCRAPFHVLLQPTIRTRASRLGGTGQFIWIIARGSCNFKTDRSRCKKGVKPRKAGFFVAHVLSIDSEFLSYLNLGLLSVYQATVRLIWNSFGFVND